MSVRKFELAKTKNFRAAWLMKSKLFLEKQDKCTEYPDFLYDTRLDRGSFYFYNTCIKFNLWKFHFDMINFHQPAWYSHFNEISKLLENWRLWIFAFRVGVFFMGSFQIILINEQMQITKFPWNRTTFFRPATIKLFLWKCLKS